MADYFTLLSRAVASLDHNTRAAREEVYKRARTVLSEQLRRADPPWPNAQIEAEAASLEAAIRQVEFEVRQSNARAASRTQHQASPAYEEIGAGEDASADSMVQRGRGPLSPVVISVIGAVVLAVIAAGSYAYLSRPGTKLATPAARTGGSAERTPSRPRQKIGRKPAPAGDGKSVEPAAASLPYELRRQFVFYRSSYSPGTIVIIKDQHMLYQIKAATVAIRYSIAIGPKCSDAIGLHRVSGKDASPVWPPPAPAGSQPQATPASSGERRADSRLGARILYLNDIEYGIHGTDKPNAIGQNSAFGCFLLADDDITDLYDRTPVDTRVVIMD